MHTPSNIPHMMFLAAFPPEVLIHFLCALPISEHLGILIKPHIKNPSSANPASVTLAPKRILVSSLVVILPLKIDS